MTEYKEWLERNKLMDEFHRWLDEYILSALMVPAHIINPDYVAGYLPHYRTPEQIEQAHQKVTTACYPPTRRYDYISEEYHDVPRSFQGWQSEVFALAMPQGKCQKSGCWRSATRSIAWNCWGVCLEAWVCDEHADCHGTWRDSL